MDSKFERKVVAHFGSGVVSIRTLDETYKTFSETIKRLLSEYKEIDGFFHGARKVNGLTKMVFTTKSTEGD